MTVVPVFSDIPPNTYYKGHPGWYSGDDVIRFLEPLFGYVFIIPSIVFTCFHII